MTGATAESTAAAKMNGGKMLCRIALDDPGTVATMTACAKAVDELAARGLIAMLEPFMSSRVNGKVHNDLSPDASSSRCTSVRASGRRRPTRG